MKIWQIIHWWTATFRSVYMQSAIKEESVMCIPLHWRHNGRSNHQHAIVYSTVNSRVDQRKHESSASLAFVRGIHRGPVNSPHKWPVTRKMFPFDDVIMRCVSWSHWGGFPRLYFYLRQSWNPVTRSCAFSSQTAYTEVLLLQTYSFLLFRRLAVESTPNDIFQLKVFQTRRCHVNEASKPNYMFSDHWFSKAEDADECFFHLASSGFEKQ